MTAALVRLREFAGPSLGVIEAQTSDVAGPAQEALRPLLDIRNGFYAFESALHVLPSGHGDSEPMTLEAWNDEGLWRRGYRDLAAGLTFFAEDAFGGQFALADCGDVVTFDPRTGATEHLAPSLDGWAQALLDDRDYLTGHSVARAWQQEHGPLEVGRRLLPTVPFVLGGEFAPTNLTSVDAVTGMRLRAEIAQQIRELPDGATVRYTVTD